ncbi:MAG: hypothetical protein A3I24_04080 [Candidatus Harrisonbacteria bacterium RIFCSPLOWO2_02_FULL_41_13b]|uniref:Aminoacyl-tRNA hydrolase n=1 Tax=Candidatus Harrisonbacteria bacterium RIFCSPLOWO2_02_FULL_41_13b TaxID=1798409 RepID=A0A1G1ZSV6_9BACT|nr:MAG: hypothetical protein A3I24_04080 [Candidatus Harrisonbacteria bacterium RIFCSPLOWO2_02_FULL_41_13b]
MATLHPKPLTLNPKLIIGLGNPEKKYRNTYHNVGLIFIKYLKDQNLYSLPYTLLASNTYMNESGRFVAQALNKYNIKPEALLIVQDDSDLEIGKYKFTEPGHSAAGHHGIESIQAALKTNNFWRLRIGIRPTTKTVRQKAEEFVLKKITAENKKILKKNLLEIIEKLKQPN